MKLVTKLQVIKYDQNSEGRHSEIHCSSRNTSIDEMKVFLKSLPIRKTVKKGRNCGNL